MSQVAIVKPSQVTEASQWTPEQMRLITEVVARGASPDELKLFLYRCNKMGLDPLKPGQVHFIKYGTSPGTIVVGIEGFRSIAGRTGKVSGIERGVHRDASGKVVAGWCKVYRSDWTHPAHEEVPFVEYTTGKGPWAKMPETMIKKVAEAAALRMAFPDDLGGVYAKEEMDQAATEAPRIAAGADQPTAEDGVLDDGVYRIPFGKYVKRCLDDVSPRDLASYIDYLEGAAVKKGQPLSPVVQEFIDKASRHIAAMERGDITS